MNNDLSILDVRLTKLEELVNMILDKDLIKSLFKEHKRLLNSEYSNLLKSLKAEMDKYNPEKQYSLRKILLLQLPTDKMEVSTYFRKVEDFITSKKLNFNSTAYEFFLVKVGLIKDGYVSRSFIDQNTFNNYLEAL